MAGVRHTHPRLRRQFGVFLFLASGVGFSQYCSLKANHCGEDLRACASIREGPFSAWLAPDGIPLCCFPEADSRVELRPTPTSYGPFHLSLTTPNILHPQRGLKQAPSPPLPRVVGSRFEHPHISHFLKSTAHRLSLNSGCESKFLHPLFNLEWSLESIE